MWNELHSLELVFEAVDRQLFFSEFPILDGYSQFDEDCCCVGEIERLYIVGQMITIV